MTIGMRIGIGLALLVAVGLALTLQRPPIDIVQRGYRGLGMAELTTPKAIAEKTAANKLPDEPYPAQPASGPKASEQFNNVKVLGDLDAQEFLRLMAAITTWVSPDQGCNYCHNPDNLASDELYTKVVARRMLQMTQRINSAWKDHVSTTGVTCYTCHRGQPVPSQVWYSAPGPAPSQTFAGNHAGKNAPAPQAGDTALPNDPFTPFFAHDTDIRVVSATALRTTDNHSIKQTEWTYGLMMHFSQALGVNCTYCHNSRAFTDWDQSTPQRNTAWYGIRMVRDLDQNYLGPLHSTFPANRLGPLGDSPKVNCATCHQGVYKPLFGASMLTGFPELAAVPKP
ncbi:MAG: photosynthetic reaction center cytochrome c subunit [Alphaproteobacteria bacterium]|nr:photosynthetic reaction center cytochrome c subunit [Alphaproteobacteria bacterium]